MRSVIYYFITGLGITAGYHRLWAHRAYNASVPLQFALAIAGTGAVEGSIKWWCRGHRAHHRYTDTELDPYSAEKGFFWSHVGWMLVKPRGKIGVADVSDLSRNRVVKWQHRHYIPLILGMGFVLPTVVAGLGWGDWRGGFFFAGAARLCFVHHVSTYGTETMGLLLTCASFSLLSVSTLLPIGLVSSPSTTSTLLETISSLLFAPLARATTTSTINSLRTSETLLSGSSMTPLSGSSGPCLSSVLPLT